MEMLAVGYLATMENAEAARQSVVRYDRSSCGDFFSRTETTNYG
jgi:hypothetical protein